MADKREQLLDFIDKKAFDPIINAKADNYSGKDKEKFEHVKEKTKNEKAKFHNDYKSAGEVKDNYLDNIRSEVAKKLNGDIRHLGLPTMPEFKDDFMKLCDKLGVSE